MPIRLYQSALNNVTYVFGHPVKFTTDPMTLRFYHAALAKKLHAARSAV